MKENTHVHFKFNPKTIKYSVISVFVIPYAIYCASEYYQKKVHFRPAAVGRNESPLIKIE
jgi:hypothetical protein